MRRGKNYEEICTSHFVCMFQSVVKVMNIVSDEEDSEDAMPGENVRLKISGAEEEVRRYFGEMIRSLVGNDCDNV